MAFVRGRRVLLVRNSLVLTALAACVVLAVLADTLICPGEHWRCIQVGEDAPNPGLWIQLGIRIALLAVLVLYMGFLRCGTLLDKLGPSSLELFSTTVITCMMVVLVLTSHMNLLGTKGSEPGEDDSCTSDCADALTISALVTVAHAGLPVRWVVLLPMEMASVVLYLAVAFPSGSCRPSHLACLLSLVAAAAVGKRTAECCERKVFEANGDVQERFWASQNAAHVGHQDSNMSSSQLSNTPSFAVFGGIEDTDDVALHLDRIAELGVAEHWCIDPNEVQVLPSHVLGEGSYGKVVQGIFCGILTAVKQPHLRIGTSKHLSSVCNELQIMRRLRHPNIVGTYGAVIVSQELRIDLILELVKGVRLKSFLDAKPPSGDESLDRSPFVRYKLMLGVCRALVYLHSRVPRIVHGDLKSSNIMVEGSTEDGFNAKLLDFGLSRIRVGGARPLGGTLAWMAPEVSCHSRHVKCSADVYSYGRLLAFIATGIMPMAGMFASTVKRLLKRGRPPPPEWPAGCAFNPAAVALVQSCLAPEEADRPSINSVHRELLELPPKLALNSTNKAFLEEVQTLAAHVCRRPAACSEESELEGALHTVLECEPLQVAAASETQTDESVRPLHSEPHTGATQTHDAHAREYEPHAGEPQATFRPAVPDKLPTSSTVMMISLCELLYTWNSEVPEAACCAVHANLRAAMRLCESLRSRPCFPDSVMKCSEQCLRCGMLGLEQAVSECEFCQGIALAPPKSQPRSSRQNLLQRQVPL